MSGWIRVDKGVFKHPMFDGFEFSRRDAWLWLLAKAAWKDTQHRIKNKVYPVPRGTLFCTLRELANEWGWKSDFKVRNFLENLEDEAMIVKSATQGKTQITICNYSLYQDVTQEKNARTTHGQRTDNALKEQNKQINKGYTPRKNSNSGIGGIASRMADEIRSQKGYRNG